MKILHIAPAYKPAYVFGGPIESVARLCEGQAGQGHSVHVYTTVAYNENVPGIKAGVETLVGGVHVTYFDTLSRNPSFIAPSLWKVLYSTVRKYDVVHISSWWNSLVVFSAIICLSRGVRVIVSPRGMLSHYILNSGKFVLKKIIHALIGKRVLVNTCLHATSGAEYQDCTSLIRGWSGFVLPNILNLPDIKIAETKNNVFTIIYLSRIHPKKGLEILFEAIGSLSLDVMLRIAGDGDIDYVRRLKNYAERLGIADKVEWVGWKSREDKFLEFMKGDLFALVSRNENFANVVIESLHMGTPVLISENVGLSEFVQREDLGWVTSLRTEDVASAISEAFYDTEKRSRIKNESRRIVDERFSSEILTLEYIEQYEKVLRMPKAVY